MPLPLSLVMREIDMVRRMPPVLAFLLAVNGIAAAQTRPPGLDAAPLDRKACAEHNLQGSGDTHETQPSNQDLSGKLAQSGGVICPPQGLDPDIRAPAPNGGRTPVIPPPAPGEALPAEPK